MVQAYFVFWLLFHLDNLNSPALGFQEQSWEVAKDLSMATDIAAQTPRTTVAE